MECPRTRGSELRWRTVRTLADAALAGTAANVPALPLVRDEAEVGEVSSAATRSASAGLLAGSFGR